MRSTLTGDSSVGSVLGNWVRQMRSKGLLGARRSRHRLLWRARRVLGVDSDDGKFLRVVWSGGRSCGGVRQVRGLGSSDDSLAGAALA